MSCGCQDTGDQLCGCCAGVTQETPVAVVNRPALPAISYRVGTYPTFLASMEAALSSSSFPALAGLRTRDSGDFSIALIDAWAEVLDILTFYTERLANEAYLGTAIEGRSVFELARLVGYKPSPGVSASTVLAFTLATAPGSPPIVPLPAGSRVQSVPGPGQLPQVFETAAALTATITNNAIPAATSIPWQILGGETSTWIAGTSNNIQTGNVLLFITAPGGVPTTGSSAAVVYVTAVTVDPVGGNTMVSWDQPLPTSVAGTAATVCVYIFRTKAALYGVNAPAPGLFALTTLGNIPPYSGVTFGDGGTAIPTDWPFSYGGSQTINLDGSYAGLNPAASTSNPALLEWVVLTGTGFVETWTADSESYSGVSESEASYKTASVKLAARTAIATRAATPKPQRAEDAETEVGSQYYSGYRSGHYVQTPVIQTAAFQIISATESNPALYALSAKTTQLTLATTAIPLSSNFGASDTSTDTLLGAFVPQTRDTTAYAGSQLLSVASLPLTAAQLSSDYPYALTTGMILPTYAETITLTGLQAIPSNAPIGVSGKRVRIASTVALTGTVPAAASNGGFTPAGATGMLAASINQPFLADAFPPISDPNIPGNLLWDVLTITGQAGTLSVPTASLQLFSSVTADALAGEAALVTVANVKGTTTVLTLAAPLQRLYDTPTLNVNANAVEASHGETMREVVGSGDATNAALQYQLKQSPLTYTSAATTSGVQSTLQVRINNLLWNEVPNFLSSAPSDRVFVTRPSPTGGPFIQFGDGITGSRTPTGTSNIQAQYRKGIGIAGMVAAGQLTQPLDRPQGLQYVTNPGPATGGADPATPASAQQSAPLPTLTLGRVVSLEDYQNFALGFAGISMALATWTWFGSTRGIFLSLAGEGGTQLNAGDQIVQNLMQAYQTYGLPNVPVLPVSYVPQNFEIGMQVLVNAPTYDPTVVIPQVWQALTAAFAFGQLAPGQSVAASQIIQLAQQIPGVTAVNLTALNLSGAGGGPPANLLCANGPVPGNASGSIPPTGAQILLLDPASMGNVGVWS